MTRRVGPELSIFIALVVLQVAPIWFFQYIPSQDGPAHLENADALLRYRNDALLQEYYDINTSVSPNWFGHLVVVALLTIVSPLTAEKILLTGYLVALPVAFRRALVPSLRQGRASWLILPFVQAFHYQMGFWSFSWSVALFFVAARHWHTGGRRLTIARGWWFATLLVLLYLVHPLGLVLTLAALVTAWGWKVGYLAWVARRRPILLASIMRAATARGCKWLPTVVPAALLFFLYLGSSPTAHARVAPSSLVARLVALRGLVALDSREHAIGPEQLVALAIAASVVGACTLVFVARRQVLSRRDQWLAVAGVFTILYFVIPETAGGGFHVNDRLGVFVFIALVVWVSQQTGLNRLMGTLAAVLAVTSVALVGLRVMRFSETQSYMVEFASAGSAIRENSVILPLIYRPVGPAGGYKRVSTFQHAAGYIAVERKSVDLTNYEASTTYFPLRFRPDRDPYRLLGTLEETICVDLGSSFQEKIDYVLTWGATPAGFASECGRTMQAQLESSFHPVFTSAPRGLARVFRNNRLRP